MMIDHISKAGLPPRKSVFSSVIPSGVSVAILLAALLTFAGCDSGGSTPPSNGSLNAGFMAEAKAGESMTYTFDASSSSDEEGQIASYEWDFGDGETGSGETTTHTYESVGDKDVTLTVTDGEGTSTSVTKTVAVESSETNYNFTSDYPYNLNVIYFVPEGMDPLPDYRDRLSGFLLYIQDYYRQWMSHWGYEKTFGLLKDQGRIKITRINGDEPVSGYPNDGGGAKIKSEVRDYFETQEATPDSKHYLVFTPKPDPDLSLPYYGLGRWGFVSDVGQKGSTAEQEGGGVVHELGHALNLPHNAHPVSRKEEIGTAIMHNGNNVWNGEGGASATSLTEASADILNEAQVFSHEEGDFYGPVDAELRSAMGTYQNGEIIISGTFVSNVPVRKAIVLLDPAGGGNYNQQSFSQTITGADSFHVSIPTSELFKTQDADYVARVWLVPDRRGRVYQKLTEFTFVDGVPKIDFQFGAISTLPKDNWEVTDFSDQEPTDNPGTGYSQVASNIIDGDWDTFWHSRYSDGEAPLPHHITVDMGEQHEVKGFQFVQREGISSGAKRVRTKEVEILGSNDGENFESLGEYTLENTGTPQQVELDSPQSFRHFKLLIKSSFGANPRAALAEVGVFLPASDKSGVGRSFKKPVKQPVDTQTMMSGDRN